MNFNKFFQTILHVSQLSETRRREPDVFIVVHRPGSIGPTPAVPVKAVCKGFDWDSGSVLLYPEVSLTELTEEQVKEISESVSKGVSWHAMEQYKKYRAQIDELKKENAQLRDELTKTLSKGQGAKS